MLTPPAEAYDGRPSSPKLARWNFIVDLPSAVGPRARCSLLSHASLLCIFLCLHRIILPLLDSISLVKIPRRKGPKFRLPLCHGQTSMISCSPSAGSSSLISVLRAGSDRQDRPACRCIAV